MSAFWTAFWATLGVVAASCATVAVVLALVGIATAAGAIIRAVRR